MIKQLAKLAGAMAATAIFAGCTHAAQLPTVPATHTATPDYAYRTAHCQWEGERMRLGGGWTPWTPVWVCG